MRLGLTTFMILSLCACENDVSKVPTRTDDSLLTVVRPQPPTNAQNGLQNPTVNFEISSIEYLGEESDSLHFEIRPVNSNRDSFNIYVFTENSESTLNLVLTSSDASLNHKVTELFADHLSIIERKTMSASEKKFAKIYISRASGYTQTLESPVIVTKGAGNLFILLKDWIKTHQLSGCQGIASLEGDWRQADAVTTLKRIKKRSKKTQRYEGSNAISTAYTLTNPPKDLSFDYSYNSETCVLTQTVSDAIVTMKVLSVNELSDSTELMLAVCKDASCKELASDLKNYLVLRRIR